MKKEVHPALDGLRERHYILSSAKHPRRWVAFSPRKVRSFQSKFGDDFCLVVAGDPQDHQDFYAIPWPFLEPTFVEKNYFPVKDKEGKVTHRWQMHLEGPRHHFQLEFSPEDARPRPKIDASLWYGNLAVLNLGAQAVLGNDEKDLGVEALSTVEGRQAVVRHLQRERDPGIVKRLKQKRLVNAGVLACEVCEFDFARVYGDHGVGYIEAHHKTPLRDFAEESSVTEEDFALVCANCHRMLHRGNPWPTIGVLRALLSIAVSGQQVAQADPARPAQ